MKTKNKYYSKKEVYLLAMAFNKSFRTIERWIKTDNDLLSSNKAKQALEKEIEKDEPEITVKRIGKHFG